MCKPYMVLLFILTSNQCIFEKNIQDLGFQLWGCTTEIVKCLLCSTNVTFLIATMRSITENINTASVPSFAI